MLLLAVTHTTVWADCKLYRSQGTVLDLVSQRLGHFNVAMLSWLKRNRYNFLTQKGVLKETHIRRETAWDWALPEFITHPLNESLFGLIGWNPSARQDRQWSRRALLSGSENAVGLQTWTDEGHSAPNPNLSLPLFIKSAFLCLCSPDPVR